MPVIGPVRYKRAYRPLSAWSNDVASLKAMLLAERSARNRGASHNNEGANHPITLA
jgi:hypothetical protein